MQSPRHSDLRMNPVDMGIFEGRYFNINRRLLKCLGLWPYVTKYEMYVIRIIAMGTLIILSVPQLIDVIVHTENPDRQIMSLIGFLTLWAMISKMIGMILAEEMLKGMYRSIANNWQLIRDENAREILHEYSERARTVIIIYITIVMGLTVFACSLPSIPKILDEIMPLEMPRSEIYLIEGEYFVDKKAHFVAFFFLNFSAILYAAFVSITYESMYIASVEHCCALYAIIRTRLSTLERIMRKNSSATEDGNSYEWLLQTIQLHQHTLTFNSLLSDSYSLTLMFVLGAALMCVPFASCAIITQLNNPLHFIPYVIYSVIAIVQGYILFRLAQRIIDHQLSIYDAAYCNNWYTTTLRTKQLLLIFMVRCTKPKIITAGGLADMNIQLFFKVLKTMASYITVASSLR